MLQAPLVSSPGQKDVRLTAVVGIYQLDARPFDIRAEGQALEREEGRQRTSVVS